MVGGRKWRKLVVRYFRSFQLFRGIVLVDLNKYMFATINTDFNAFFRVSRGLAELFGSEVN